MTLSFPNRMRVADPDSGRIAFSGHEGVTEIRFSIPYRVIESLSRSRLDTTASYLAAFDVMRERIQDVAARTHAQARRPFHILDASQF
ncbi:DUF1488 family protein [Pannonibacter phragmitetus]|uniref:DUF1488 family protein n=1 Tax=Pannonibacter phragmitetus TaxID=121719 RepID=UPI003D2F0CBA